MGYASGRFTPMTAQRQGLLLCLVAAVGFSTTGIFATLAYQSHTSVTTVLNAIQRGSSPPGDADRHGTWGSSSACPVR